MIEPKITPAERLLAFLQGIAERAAVIADRDYHRRLERAKAAEASAVRLRKRWFGRS